MEADFESGAPYRVESPACPGGSQRIVDVADKGLKVVQVDSRDHISLDRDINQGLLHAKISCRAVDLE